MEVESIDGEEGGGEREEQLSPIVGYQIESDDENVISSSSDTDVEAAECLSKLNERLERIVKQPVLKSVTPRSSMRKRIRKRRCREMKAEEDKEIKRRKLLLQVNNMEVDDVEEEEEKEIKEEPPVAPDSEPQSSRTEPTLVMGFQTAGGKQIAVSEKALRFAKQSWTKAEANLDVAVFRMPSLPSPSSVDKEQSMRIIEEKSDPESSMGFRTAGGKEIAISEKAMRIAKQSWSKAAAKLDTEIPGLPSKSSSSFAEKQNVAKMQEEPDPGFMGFKTASEKQISVSEKAMRIAKQSWSKAEAYIDTEVPRLPSISSSSFGQDESVKMTQEIQDLCDALFQDDDDF